MSDVSYIGPDLKLRGILEASHQTVIIEGRFEGEIKARHLHIMQGSYCEAIIHTETAQIDGRFAGVLHTDTLGIGDSAEVGGELVVDAITIDTGANVSGQIVRRNPDMVNS